ncbi:MAG: co-chaperone YbbN [Acidimicrobiaceae bacterium]|jgi:putative thioredoxin|nr:co-chaperone YbbN [Acidimicrobiaceae bacterium]MDP6480350.1 tetratricopeptide repeat protein [Acidimicrobiales bacterium]MDP6696863.1 tetratricopeptide repeat protein [Acidimicrobiales bacterium]|tara:strand:- start:955 stop:1656 length:702 start_codon:yes stop_codon:yes gene_type:complete
MDVTDATFQEQVLDRSSQVPVVVDLWADWCGPCRSLTPIIEKVVAETGGRVELAKVDIDSNPGVAQSFQVQSIPAVYGIRDGQVVGSFVGAQGEEAVRSFVLGLMADEQPDPVDLLVEAGDESSLRQAVDLEPKNPRAVCALAALLIERDGEGDGDEALAFIAQIPESPETRRLAALARVEAVDDIDATLGELLELASHDEEARDRFIDLLEVLGPDDERTSTWRRRLTSALY